MRSKEFRSGIYPWPTSRTSRLNPKISTIKFLAMLDDKNLQLTPLEKLGEFGLIKHLTESFPIQNDSTTKGIGDDAAILNFEGKEAVISTDMLVEGVH